MAQSGFTPIQLYRTSTAAAVPSAANLIAGELAINYTDGKLFYEDNGGVVQVIATKDSAAGIFTNLSCSGTLTGGAGIFTNLSYSGTLTGGTGVVNIGSGQLYKDAAGLIGLGTILPGVKLDVVSGNVGIRHTSSETVGTIRVGSTGVGGGGQFEAFQNGTLVGAVGAAGAFTGTTSDNFAIGAARSGAGVDIYTNGSATLVARFNSTGQFSVGTTSTTGKISAETLGGERALYLRNSSTDGVIQLNSNTHASVLRTISGGGISIGTDASFGDSEGLRLIGTRFFKASNTGSYGGVAGLGSLLTNNSHNFQSDENNTVVASISSSTGSSVTCFDAFLPTGAAGQLFKGSLNAVTQFAVGANGDVTNTNGSYGTISDVKLKENVIDAPNYLDRFMKVRFRNFNFIGSGVKQFGVVAQELEKIFPGLVGESPDTRAVTKTRSTTIPAVVSKKTGSIVSPSRTVEEEYIENELTGTSTKYVKSSVLHQIQGRVIQEQQEIIKSLIRRIEILEGLTRRIEILESR